MAERPGKGRPPIEVVKRPAAPGAPAPQSPQLTPARAAPRPVAPRAVVPVRPASLASAAASPAGGAPAPAAPTPTAAAPAPGAAPPAGARPPRAPGKFPPRRPPARPPTQAEIDALARKERVPTRIAKGELDGKMKSRIWRKLHAQEAKRFDEAWALVDSNPTLALADAFGVLQSGMTLEEFQARRARAKKKEEVKAARTSVDGAAIDAFVEGLKGAQTELAFVLGERTVLDTLAEVQPVAFMLGRSGRLEKLQVVVLGSRAAWEALAPSLQREPKLSQKPQGVARQPAKRPISDPRPFLEHVGKPVRLLLRNGIALTEPVQAAGPFDLLVGSEGGATFFVPLHAIVEWAPLPG